MNADERVTLVAQVRDASLQAALTGYEDAWISGLCGKGALEAAIGSIRQIDLNTILRQVETEPRNRGES